MKTIKFLRNKANIPNIEGFEFYAVMPDGTINEDKVIIVDGLHKCQYFKQMIGWIYKNFEL